MTIQLNADNNLSIHQEFRMKLNDMLTGELERFSDQITRLEVHLSDEDGPKKSLNDKRCLLEARLVGLNPVAVSNYSDTHENSVSGAIDKLISALDRKIGKLNSR
jgi:ribosome-associated translation inhibitor RaiA